MVEIDPAVALAQVVNWLVLILVVLASIVAAVLVGRDAHRRGRSWASTMAWALLSLAVFPVGVALYLYERRAGG